MALTNFTDDLNIHQSLSDTPNATEGYTPLELKTLFDKAPNLIKTWINNVLISAFNAHLAENVSQVIAITRDLSLTGIQTVSNFAGRKLKAAYIIGSVLGTKKASWGVYSSNGGESIYVFSDSDTFSNASFPIAFSDLSTTNRTLGQITNVQEGSFDINWTHTGTGATGTAGIKILAIFHD